jgi:hypothetical protein
VRCHSMCFATLSMMSRGTRIEGRRLGGSMRIQTRTWLIVAVLLMLVGISIGQARTQPAGTNRASALVWEIISSRTEGPEPVDFLVYRASVPGGWLVSVIGRVPMPGQAATLRPGEVPVTTTFVPDAQHEWRAASR